MSRFAAVKEGMILFDQLFGAERTVNASIELGIRLALASPTAANVILTEVTHGVDSPDALDIVSAIVTDTLNEIQSGA